MPESAQASSGWAVRAENCQGPAGTQGTGGVCVHTARAGSGYLRHPRPRRLVPPPFWRLRFSATLAVRVCWTPPPPPNGSIRSVAHGGNSICVLDPGTRHGAASGRGLDFMSQRSVSPARHFHSRLLPETVRSPSDQQRFPFLGNISDWSFLSWSRIVQFLHAGCIDCTSAALASSTPPPTHEFTLTQGQKRQSKIRWLHPVQCGQGTCVGLEPEMQPSCPNLPSLLSMQAKKG